MSASTDYALKQSEEEHMNSVYKALDDKRKKADKKVIEAEADLDSGAYEDQDKFLLAASKSKAWDGSRETTTLVQALYKKPYFSHIEVVDKESSDREHYYLSDCDTLNELICVGNGSYLIPFKQDKKRPLLSALFRCYHAKQGDPISCNNAEGEKFILIPQLICDDEIENRRLKDAVRLFPETETFVSTADEMLEKKLRENGNNPTLRNIISTLQRAQFEIIETDVKQSFVVQGCAGSGKSQCLLHRLFFLRDSLSQEGWEHVLLLTPTQLFRNYSEDLIRRYQLSSVENCSIADLYRTLLNAYDVRFKNRQYRFELSEEYLPDEYLHEVYNDDIIRDIDDEIINAIHKYVSNGCAALGVEVPAQITAVEIEDLVKRLDEEIKKFAKRESLLQKDEQYAEKRKQYEESQKELEALQKHQEKLTGDYNKITNDISALEILIADMQEAEKEKDEWFSQREESRCSALKELSDLKMRWNEGNDIQIPARYAMQLAVVHDMLYGERFKADEEYAQFLCNYCDMRRAELNKIANNQAPDKVLTRYEKRKEDILQKSKQLTSQIEEITAQIEQVAQWLRDRASAVEGEKSQVTLRRSEMESARYFLTRIESTIFEREVWNAIAPLKKKYNVQALQLEEMPDGHQKETRILYKSDMLFYLKIYAFLYPKAKLPDYRLICVDEGQDLHKADYDMMHKLYPKAVFNVFGDTRQVLHTACGVHDWQTDTGINETYSLNHNYRNAAEIVDFCNREFGSSMEYVGRVREERKPHKIDTPVQLKSAAAQPKMTLIVKDRSALVDLCMKMGKSVLDFEYLDTKADKLLGGKIPCYSIFAAKGLEFSKVLVYAAGMTNNQKVVAATRAMEELYYYE